MMCDVVYLLSAYVFITRIYIFYDPVALQNYKKKLTIFYHTLE
jgi:hypothetical protein